jgi:predicted DNA-binding transcriptional regulator AlpA
MTTTPTTDRYLTVPELIERWPIGRTKIYEIVKSPGFPPALVLLFDRNDRPRSMGFLLSDILAFEDCHLVHASELDLLDEDDSEPTLPPAKRAMPKRKVG